MSLISRVLDAVSPAPKTIAQQLDAALLACSTALAAIADPPAPTLATIPEAQSEFEAALAEHRTACEARASERAAVLAAASKRLASRLTDAPDSFVAETRAAVASTEKALAQLQDPEPPVLGTPTPGLVAALTVALRKHPQQLKAQEALRDASRATLLASLHALRQAAVASGTLNQVFNGRSSAGQPVDFSYIEQRIGGLNPALCEIYRAALVGSDAEDR
jgi:hypothetical protein